MVGTFISSLVFGFATYALVLIGLVRRSHLAGSPFIECLAYGACLPAEEGSGAQEGGRRRGREWWRSALA